MGRGGGDLVAHCGESQKLLGESSRLPQFVTTEQARSVHGSKDKEGLPISASPPISLATRAYHWNGELKIFTSVPIAVVTYQTKFFIFKFKKNVMKHI